MRRNERRCSVNRDLRGESDESSVTTVQALVSPQCRVRSSHFDLERPAGEMLTYLALSSRSCAVQARHLNPDIAPLQKGSE